MRLILTLLLSTSALFAGTGAFAKEFKIGDLRNGDLIFQSRDCGPICEQIEATLKTPYSHLGMVYFDPTGIRIIESTDRVRLTPLNEWLAHSRTSTVDVMRLRSSSQHSGYGESLAQAALKQMGKPYDDEWDWDDSRLYCSELIWKSFKAGLKLELSTPKDYHDELTNTPNALFWQGYFRGPVPHRLGVSPKDLAGSRYLEKIGSLKVK